MKYLSVTIEQYFHMKFSLKFDLDQNYVNGASFVTLFYSSIIRQNLRMQPSLLAPWLYRDVSLREAS